MKIVIIGSGLAGHLVLRGLRAKGFSGEIVLISEHLLTFIPNRAYQICVK